MIADMTRTTEFRTGREIMAALADTDDYLKTHFRSLTRSGQREIENRLDDVYASVAVMATMPYGSPEYIMMRISLRNSADLINKIMGDRTFTHVVAALHKLWAKTLENVAKDQPGV